MTAALLVVKQAMAATRTGEYRRALIRVQRALASLEGLEGERRRATGRGS